MALDLNQVAAQIDRMAAGLKAEEINWKGRLIHALELLNSQSANLDRLRARIEGHKTSLLVAGVTGRLDRRYQPPTCPPDYTAIATDGSHIDVDRHSPARCYLVNIGCSVLRYGNAADATLFSRPTLYASKEDLVIENPNGSDEQLIEGGLLGIKRSVAECHALVELGEKLGSNLPAVALLDGSLILWALAGRAYPDYVRDEMLKNGFLPALERIREVSRKTSLALASYISLPRSREVVNTLTISICPYDPPNCDRHCPRNSTPRKNACEVIAGLRDRDLFGALLEPGERSETFISLSSVVRDYYGDHEVRFFYLNTGDEIARVEIPRWVEDMGHTDTLHALVLDQCRRGQGYPVALSESHEQAVVRASDREQFQRLVELALSRHSLSTATSEKNRSKRTRWI